MLGSPGHNLKHLESWRSVFHMSLGMAARTSKAKICTKGSLIWFMFFLGLLYCGTGSKSPPKHPNAQSAHPEPWQELPALGHLVHLKTELVVSVMLRSPWVVSRQELCLLREVLRHRTRRCVFVPSTALGSRMGALHLFGEEGLLMFSWVYLCRTYHKWATIKTGNSREYQLISLQKIFILSLQPSVSLSACLVGHKKK